jgi:ubiquinone/menaquinone biosynthesis C-methylase UbiE
MDKEEIISSAKERFDHELHTNEYKKIHSDDEQRERLISKLGIEVGKQYLDIGTGNGYLAFEIAKKYPDSIIKGLDIAEHSIAENNVIASKKNLGNIKFFSYDGKKYPFTKKQFNGAISRYAFHHFPDIEESIKEISRVLCDSGHFILSDPMTYEEDTEGFIDSFQKQIKDGHVHFYKRKEVESLFSDNEFVIEDEFSSVVRYPRAWNYRYDELFDKTDSSILKMYHIERENEKVFVQVEVMNILFRKLI